MTDKENECARLEKLGKILDEAEGKLEAMDYWWYKEKLCEMKKTIEEREIISEMEKRNRFRSALCEKLALALAVAFGGMASASGLIGAIHLAVCISSGAVKAIGTLAWMSVTIGLVALSMVSKTAADVM